MRINIRHIYFVGIGGIGMSSLARYFNENGDVSVWGYDKTPSALTKQLNKEGIPISFVDSEDQIPAEIIECKTDSLIVYTPAIPSDNKVLNYFKKHSFDLKKRSEVLGLITSETVNLSVAGTHGKTTTSSMVATILQHSNVQFSAFLGGISTNLGSNYFYQKGNGDTHYSITEADEFDRSFLHLEPDYAVVTSTDADHLDIYGTKEDMQETYKEFAALVEDNNKLFFAKNKAQGIIGKSYSAYENDCDYYAKITYKSGRGSHFSIYKRNGEVEIEDLYLNIPGLHNVENAIGATLMTLKAGVELDAVRAGLKNFAGIKRRFEYVIVREDFVYIDDYAHHPSELKAIISSVRDLYPNRKITAIFQPHLFSRTADFMDEFANELDQADEVILLPIYPARELPMEGVTSNALLSKLSLTESSLVEKTELISTLKEKDLEVLLTLGAGDIDRLVEPIKESYGN